MQIKQQLRKNMRLRRLDIENKNQLDSAIADNLIESDIYKNADVILCYMSLDDEISTDAIIADAFRCGKSVAVPYCTDNKGTMDFYYINSFDDLTSGSFNVREPLVHKCKKVVDFSGSICIVPAFCFDKKGFRLGYGKGYYDRFLQKYPLISVGLCYNNFIQKSIPTDIYDQSVNYIITEKQIISCNCGGENG